MGLQGWIRRRFWGLAVGTVVTALVTIAYAAGWTDRVGATTLDLAFRYVNHIDADDRIVLIDINDPAIERIGRWPWPRRYYADLVDSLHEAGAAIIAMDIVLPEPMPPRIEHPDLSKDYDVDPPRVVLGDVHIEDAIKDDDELAAALRRAGNVYMAMFSKLARPDRPVERMEAEARKLFDQDPEADLETFIRRTGVARGESAEQQFEQQRLAWALEDDFSLDVDALAERLDESAEAVELHLADAKRLAARRLAAQFLLDHSAASFEEFYRRVLPDRPLEERTPDRAELIRGYRTERALGFVLGPQPDVPAGVRGHLAHGWDLAPPVDKIAEAARGVAFVTFEPDRVDGVFRHLPVVIEVGGKLVPHLGFAVASDLLKLDTKSIAWRDDGALTVRDRAGKRQWEIPLGDDGRTLINWHLDRSHPEWTRSFVHVPAARVMEVPLNRRAMVENEKTLQLTMAEAVALRFADNQAGYADYAALVRRRNDLKERNQPPPASLVAAIENVEQQTRDWLVFMRQSIAGVEPQDESEEEEFAQYRRLHGELVEGTLAQQIEQKNERLAKRNEQLQAELRAKLEGKVCFVGYTATAVADTVNSPVFENMPGVLAHANVLNTIVQDRFPRVAPRWISATLIVVSGLLVTLLTSSRGPWVSLICVVVLMAALLLLGASFFRTAQYFLDGGIIAVFAVFVSWAFITLYRQVVEERQRRQIAKSLARQTSPAIAAQLAHGKTEADFVPQPAVVTCYFSDLQGFTALSEALGPERTKNVLNRYLAVMSQVLLKHQGSSKFMGDGIFAYFNSPIWPCPDHVIAGCEAALESRSALEELKRSESGGEFAREFDSLVMRAGLNSGPVFAGNYGSGDRAEYTCIGDTVNLAARLEPANKVFGTEILVSETCHEALSDRYVFRWLGKLQVKGKTRAVGVYELISREGEATADQTRYAECFARAVDLFQQRQWDPAREAFERCRALRHHDPAIELYCAEISRLTDNPPPEDWNQGLELTTK
jgi:class 3 adenylate cyclase